MEDVSLQYNFPFESYKNWAIAATTGSYNSTNQIINLASGTETGLFPVNLPFQVTWFNATDYPSVYDDPALEVVLITGRHTSGFFGTRSQNYTTGAPHTGTKLNYLIGSVYASNYEQWKLCNNPDEGTYLFDDFDWGVSTSSVLGWTSAGNAATIISQNANFTTSIRPGTIRFVENLAVTGNGLVRLNDKLLRLDSGPVTFKTAFQFQSALSTAESTALSGADWRWGLGDAIPVTTFSGNLVNGLYFQRTASEDNARIYIVAAKDGVISKTSTEYTGYLANTTATTAGYRDYKIEVINSGLVRFSINNVEVSGSPLTSNIPWGSGYEVGPFYYLQKFNITGGGTLSYMADYADITQSFTGYRTNPLLYEDLVAYWPFNRLSGSGIDIHRTNHLTGAINNPIGTSGLLVSGRQFNGTNQSLFVSSGGASELMMATGFVSGDSFTLWGWAYPKAKNANMGLFGRYDSNTSKEYGLFYDTNLDRFKFVVNRTSSISGVVTGLNPIGTNQWYFVLGYHNLINRTIGLRVNNSETVISYSGVQSGVADFEVGKLDGQYFSGIISEVGLARRSLTTGEKDYLYNFSGGLAYESLIHFNEYYEKD